MEPVQFKVDENKDKCWLFIDDVIINQKVSKEDIVDTLKSIGIVSGIKYNLIDSLMEGKYYNEKQVVIAENIKPAKGIDGKVKYLISDDTKVNYDSHGNADFYELNQIKNVVSGTKLLEIIPPKEGKIGISIFGEKIPGVKGDEILAKKYIGIGTRLSKNERFIEADINGIYKKTPLGAVSVVDELEIDGDLDFSVGNIITTSSVFIRGDIKSGFRCCSKNSIMVNGAIEDAAVESSGDIICKYGILQGDEPIIAKKQIWTNYISNRKSVECKEIFVEDMISNSYIKAIESIQVGKLVGGKCVVLKTMTADEIGNKQFIRTEIEMGINYKVLEAIEKNKAEVKNADDQIDEIEYVLKDTITNFKRNQIKYRKILKENPKNEKILDAMQNEFKNYTLELNTLNGQIKNLILKKDILKHRIAMLIKKTEGIKPELIVKGVVYPNVSIRLSSTVIYVVEKELRRVKFFIDDADELKVVHI